jgi:hypothetical protein
VEQHRRVGFPEAAQKGQLVDVDVMDRGELARKLVDEALVVRRLIDVLEDDA